MKIALTGASGFIGNKLADYLKMRGYNVIALVRSREKATSLESIGIKTNICDITDKNSLRYAFENVETVIHVAALFNNPEASWDDYLSVNVGGTQNVLDEAMKRGVKRVIHCSTIGVATGHGKPPYSEQTPYSPAWDKYEHTKCEGEKLALNFHKNHGFPVVVIRPAQVYGPGDRAKVKFYKLVKKGIIVNPGKTMKHLIYIDDLCRAFELAMVKDNIDGEAFIIGGEKPTPLKEYIKIASHELGVSTPRILLPSTPITWICTATESLFGLLKRKPPLFRRSMDFFTKSVAFDVSKAKRQLGFESQTDVPTGVKQTVAWYRDNGLI